MTKLKAIKAVQEKYGEKARGSLTNGVAAMQAIAEALGYTATELTSIPAAANMDLSCGNRSRPLT
jgi:arsenite methyltransferase